MSQQRPRPGQEIRRQAQSKLESWRRAGVTHLGRGARATSEKQSRSSSAAAPEPQDQLPASAAGGVVASSATSPPSRSGSSAKKAPATASPGAAAENPAPNLLAELEPWVGPGEPLARRLTVLDEIRGRVAACTRCPELVANRTQTVFGVGNPQARLCFLGEAPGADEDRQGEPFVGRAGQLLNKILDACGLERSEIYILNICKCRPPENRAPESTEAANCREYLDGQLETIRPEFLCCLGAVAAQNLLGLTTSIGRLRGRLHDHRGIRVLCTYHPAYLLRNPPMKRECWEDMKLLMREMGRPVD